MKKKILILVVLFVLSLFSSVSCKIIHTNDSITKQEESNSINIQANYFVKSGEWIYFSSPLDENKLYKMKTDLSKKQKVMDEKVYGQFIIDQDWLYYTTSHAKYENILKKIHLDGSNKSILVDLSKDKETIKEVYLKALQDGWIYFEKLNNIGYYLFRVKTDGSQQKLLNMKKSILMNVRSEWIIYQDFEDNRSIYKMKTDGSNKTKLNKVASINLICYKDWIYFNNLDDKGRFYKININGGENIQLSTEGNITPLAIHDGWIYYTDYTKNFSLYKAKEDMSATIQLTSSSVGNITLIDDWIYYNSLDSSRRLYRVSISGSDRIEILK